MHAVLLAALAFSPPSPARLPTCAARRNPTASPPPLSAAYSLTPSRDSRTRDLQMAGRGSAAEDSASNPLQDAWSRYVLLRPGMRPEELRETTQLRTAKSWSWAERTPGTARTILFTIAFISIVAIPTMLRNPAVYAYLLEFAALSREGASPAEIYKDLWASFFSSGLLL